MMIDFERIPDPPETVGAGSVMARLLDGLGFRFRWATTGLQEADYAFRPGPDTMSIGELVAHTWGVVNWVGLSVFGEERVPRPSEAAAQRLAVLEIVSALRDAFSAMDDEALQALTIGRGQPFWNMINGPIADALTHVGQINAFRRLAGNPTPQANVFLGQPPA